MLDLHGYGRERLRTGKDIIDSLSCMNLGKIDDKDLAHLIQGAVLLLRDGYDIWKVVEVRALEADRQGSFSAGIA